MSIINDYSFSIHAVQRQRDLAAEANSNRLGREARNGRSGVFTHLLTGVSRGSYRPARTAVAAHHHAA